MEKLYRADDSSIITMAVRPPNALSSWHLIVSRFYSRMPISKSLTHAFISRWSTPGRNLYRAEIFSVSTTEYSARLQMLHVQITEFEAQRSLRHRRVEEGVCRCLNSFADTSDRYHWSLLEHACSAHKPSKRVMVASHRVLKYIYSSNV